MSNFFNYPFLTQKGIKCLKIASECNDTDRHIHRVPKKWWRTVFDSKHKILIQLLKNDGWNKYWCSNKRTGVYDSGARTASASRWASSPRPSTVSGANGVPGRSVRARAAPASTHRLDRAITRPPPTAASTASGSDVAIASATPTYLFYLQNQSIVFLWLTLFLMVFAVFNTFAIVCAMCCIDSAKFDNERLIKLINSISNAVQ